MLTKPCAKCGKLVRYPDRVCSRCATKEAEKKKEAERHYNRNCRDKRIEDFYNSLEWRRASEEYLRKKRFKCEDCGGIATLVHHVVEVRDCWERRLDETNYRAQCTSCHNKKHHRGWAKKSMASRNTTAAPVHHRKNSPREE